MALPTVVIDNVNGSNTAASGAGPASAVTGSAAAHTGGSASTTITLTNSPDLSGVATDGSAVIYLATSSGRKFSKITAVDNSAKTVTVEDSFTIASGGSAVDYAIGGKRKDFETTNSNTKQLFSDAKAGWTIDILETGTNYVVTSAIALNLTGSTTVGYIYIKSSSVNRPLITTATDSISIFDPTTTAPSWLFFSHLSFSHTAATRGTCFGNTVNTFWGLSCFSCVFDGFTTPFSAARFLGGTFDRCTVKNCTVGGLVTTTSGTWRVYRCAILNNAGNGLSEVDQGSIVAIGNLIAGNSGKGISQGAPHRNGSVVAIANTIAGNGSDGIEARGNPASGGSCTIILANNLIYGNGGYGITSGSALNLCDGSHNAFGSNTSGARNNVSALPGDVALTATPFTNSGSGDFSLNNTAGGGAACRAAGFPGVFPGGLTTGYLDIGAVQHQDAGGGGGSGVRRYHIGSGVCVG